jgi:hypothetical protein
MTNSLPPSRWVAPLRWPTLDESAFSNVGAARCGISWCHLAGGTATDGMLRRRADASREEWVRSPHQLTDEPTAMQSLPTLTTKSRSSAAPSITAGQHSSHWHEAKVEEPQQ